MSPASSTWLAIACSNSGYPALSNTIPGKRSLIRLKNKGSSSSIYDKRACLDIKKNFTLDALACDPFFFSSRERNRRNLSTDISCREPSPSTFLPEIQGHLDTFDLTRRVNPVYS